jgi:2,5-diamino-6-(ribosylamino)-4(3H)-pyrimidinone 5'-phosphate reductase
MRLGVVPFLAVWCQKSLKYPVIQPLCMLPKVIVYNSISLDGAIKDFNVNLPLHYEVLGQFGADALLAGSATAKSGIELFHQTVPSEEPRDLQKPLRQSNDSRPLWVIPDSRGVLHGLLHVHRKSGYAKDILILVSRSTPQSYLNYLSTRSYDFIVAGEDHVDMSLALSELGRRYGVRRVVTDSGGVLASHLLETGLVDEVALLVAPEIVGENAVTLFRGLKQPVALQLLYCKTLQGQVLLTYTVNKASAKDV